MQRNLIVWAAGCVAVTAVVAVVLFGNLARADEPVVKQLYGSGVHAYFEGQNKEAHTFLSEAIKRGSLDPRVYYFRGMAHWELGRPDEAKVDFVAGAKLEAAALDDIYGVDRSLERVQGKARLLIEEERLKARNEAAALRQKIERLRYNRIESNEPNVLEGFSPKLPPEKTPPPKAKQPAPPAKETTSAVFDPFGERRIPGVTPAPAVAALPKVVPMAKQDAPKQPAPPEPKAGQPRVNGKGATVAALKAIAEALEAFAPPNPADLIPPGGLPLPGGQGASPPQIP